VYGKCGNTVDQLEKGVGEREVEKSVDGGKYHEQRVLAFDDFEFATVVVVDLKRSAVPALALAEVVGESLYFFLPGFCERLVDRAVASSE